MPKFLPNSIVLVLVPVHLGGLERGGGPGVVVAKGEAAEGEEGYDWTTLDGAGGFRGQGAIVEVERDGVGGLGEL